MTTKCVCVCVCSQDLAQMMLTFNIAFVLYHSIAISVHEPVIWDIIFKYLLINLQIVDKWQHLIETIKTSPS
jgi:hypothetical protein